ncbi:hypothetical protein DICVIV_03049 [Dictyocaulus viviparus]|uniref:Uncharacterized protein n=1 Tax=Dictyocaulus viviparus TaxID=29172 RepID=A0A0D8Y280_DICVI|nr:hypothetical protein DICVIV_03049 [Dictyocaulus viviparus]
MQPAGLIEEGVVPLGAEETIVTSEGTNISSRSAVVTRQVCGGNATVGNPAVLSSRCQSTTVSQGGQSLPRMLSSSRTGVINSSAAPSRPSISLSSGAGAGKLLMVRRSDGTTQFLRQISQNSSKPLTSYVIASSTSTHFVLRQLPVGRTRLPQITRALPTQLVQRPVRRDQEQYAPNRVVAESSTVRPGFEQQSADPVMKRVAPGKLVYGSNIASSGMENVFQRVQDSRNNTSPSDRVSISGRYGQTSATYKVTSRGLASSSQDLRSEQNSHRVYYVKNALATTPSRVMLTPTSFDSYDHEEVVLDNDGIVIDGDETLDHADALSS